MSEVQIEQRGGIFRRKGPGGIFARLALNYKLFNALLLNYDENPTTENFNAMLALNHFLIHAEIITPDEAGRRFRKEWDNESECAT